MNLRLDKDFPILPEDSEMNDDRCNQISWYNLILVYFCYWKSITIGYLVLVYFGFKV